MNNVTPFDFNDHSVRVIERNGEAWFVLADVAQALEYRMASDAARTLDDDEKGTHSVRTPSGDQSMTVINESGLYSLTLKSRKPSAKRFKKWVTSEVLPSIRKTGGYAAQPAATPVTAMQKAVSDMREWKDAASLFGVPEAVAMVEGVKHVERAHDVDFKPLLLASPMMDDIKDDEVMLEPSEIGKRIGYSGKEVNIALCKAGLQTKEGGEWTPTESAQGYTSRHFWMSKHSGKSGYNYKWNLEFVRQQLGK